MFADRVRRAISTLRYRRVYRRLSRLPLSEQMRHGRLAYSIVWSAYHDKVGDRPGSCIVHFTCPSRDLVRSHLEDELKVLVDDDKSPISSFTLVPQEDGYTLLVSVSTSDAYPEVVADAAAMSSVLRVPHVGGDFHRRSWSGDNPASTKLAQRDHITIQTPGGPVG